MFQVFKDAYTLVLGHQGDLTAAPKPLIFLPRMFQAISQWGWVPLSGVSVINSTWQMQWVLHK